MIADEIYFSAAQVRKRYANVSDMWIWRRLHDESGFPKPIVMNKRRYWRHSELVEWEKSHESLGAA